MKPIFLRRPHILGTDHVYIKIIRYQYFSVFNIYRTLPFIMRLSTKYTLPINLLNIPK